MTSLKKISLPPLSKTIVKTSVESEKKNVIDQKSKILPPLEIKKLDDKKETKKVEKVEKVEICSQPPQVSQAQTQAQVTQTLVEKDPTKYIETYFGVRNGIEGKPIKGINYTVETLTYMTSHNRADQITNIIVKKMQEYGESIPFQVFECCGGIGGNTLSFLENKNISKVFTYECDLQRREMLKKNVEMYKLSNKFVGVDKPFTEAPCEYSKAVMFFDPPWLTSEIKGHEATKEQYVLSGIKIGDKTLEDWVKSYPYSSLIAIKVPLGYKLNPISNFKYEDFEFKNSLLIILKPDSKVHVESKECILESIQKERKKEKEEQKEQKEKEEEIWKENLRKFIRNDILSNIIKDPQSLDKLVNEEAMKIWAVAFTHESYNPNVGENYEELELYGDEIMAACYVKFLMYNYPGFTRSELSELRTHYISKPFQAPLSRKLGLGNYVRTRFKKSAHIYEDVLESFLGALEMIGDKVFKFGSGMGLAYNMIIFLYGDVEIERVYSLANPKTRVKELFEKMGWINPKLKEFVPEEVSDDGLGNITFTISLTQSGFDYLKNKGIPITTQIIARTTASTKKLASDEAYIMAIKTLETYKLEVDVTNKKENKGRKGLESLGFPPLIEAIQDRLKSEGYVNFYFFEHHGKGIASGTTAKYIQLIGIDKEGRKTILGSTPEPVTDIVQGKKQLLIDFSNYK